MGDQRAKACDRAAMPPQWPRLAMMAVVVIVVMANAEPVEDNEELFFADNTSAAQLVAEFAKVAVSKAARSVPCTPKSFVDGKRDMAPCTRMEKLVRQAVLAVVRDAKVTGYARGRNAAWSAAMKGEHRIAKINADVKLREQAAIYAMTRAKMAALQGAWAAASKLNTARILSSEWARAERRGTSERAVKRAVVHRIAWTFSKPVKQAAERAAVRMAALTVRRYLRKQGAASAKPCPSCLQAVETSRRMQHRKHLKQKHRSKHHKYLQRRKPWG